MLKDLKINDTAWWAKCGTKDVKIPCPVCYGKLKVTVILGNDEWFETPCDYCGSKTWEGAKGYVIEYQWVAEPEVFVVAGISSECGGEGCKVQYKTHHGYLIDAEELFESKEAAQVRCDERIAEHDAEEKARLAWGKENSKKSYSWHVGYYKREIKEAERKIEYAKARLIPCQAKAKEDKVKQKEQDKDNLPF
jgi:hypothetical protein